MKVLFDYGPSNHYVKSHCLDVTVRASSLAFSPDGKEMASAGDDNAIRLWDVNGGGLIAQIGTHTKPVLSVAYAADGKRIVSGEHDYSVRLYMRRRSLWGYRPD